MRISFVLPPVGMSGGIRVVAIYAKLFAEHGHQVVLVAPPAPRPRLKRRLKLWLKGQAQPPRSEASHLDGLGLDFRTLATYRPIVDADLPDADVVIATWWETAEWVAALSPAKGAKVYFVQHHEVFSWLPRERVAATYRLPLHKVVIAGWLAREMAETYGDHDTDLVPNSVDHHQFFAPPRGRQARPTIGFMYSTTDFKGVDVTLAAIAKLRERRPDLATVAFGGHARLDEVCPGTNYLPDPPQDRIREVYAACDVWVTASRSEGFNLPAMEAMACRCPVVSTRTGWPEEAIVDGVNGWLVPVDDVDALAEAIERVLALPEPEWRAMSEAAHDTVKDSHWGDCARRFEAVLARVVARGRDAGMGANEVPALMSI